ncbi:SDR family oxidoreductase [Rhodococcus jostii]|uniref:NAD(P)-dependent dehydrogenase, short-chain alcohol dehydrogenase family n=1 Tax=Rhodococcus jostii TaxID=132919 RepID=A0A1H5H799_RHOJO|nr:SDR family oxidoreductase [Rhodococcus jostii]SEE23872.1 NAD(P)-dependent dehydrogenase, short-chain alcohol dehydrogenase family [Rhodococcus jostii]
MNGILDGKVVVITGAGRGIGRGYALEFARHGAKVVVNDLGGPADGSGSGSGGPADDVVAEIVAAGGEAVANTDDVADEQGARNLIDTAITTFGGLDVLVNNAGILRDRTVANMSFQEWDSVIRVHLRGTFGPTHYAVQYWREQHKAGNPVDARVINTSSSSGLYCNPGQANYGAAKAGIAAFTVITAQEVARYGVTVNAIYPTALSRLTEDVFSKIKAKFDTIESDFDAFDPDNIAPAVVWLAGPAARDITGRVFGLRGGKITVAEGWVSGPTVEVDRRWRVEELDAIIPDLVSQARPNAGTDGRPKHAVAAS